MSVIKTMMVGAALAAATGAYAQSLRVNDIHYIYAARCQGLITSSALGTIDPTGINRFVDLESAGRTPLVSDQAADARNRAKREAATAGPEEKAKLVSERDGPCQEWASMGATAAAGQLTGS